MSKNMHGIIKQVIKEKEYVLGEMLERINIFCARGDITIEEQEELTELARANASAEVEVDLFKKVVELDSAVKLLTARLDAYEKENKEETETAVAYPPFVVGKWYYAGDTCSEAGFNFVCAAPEGQVCTWSPSQYPPYWKQVDA